MKIWTSETQFDGDRSAVALGTFDGLHIGHQALIRRAVSIARECGAMSVVSTFDGLPRAVLCPDQPIAQLLTLDEKIAKLEALGVDAVVVAPFTREFARIAPEDYLRDLAKNMRPVAIVAGFNYTFGAGGRGNVRMICDLADALNYRAEIVQPVTDAGENVSSTLIRRLIAQGDIQRAERLLRIAD